jgi:hypothetical protein
MISGASFSDLHRRADLPWHLRAVLSGRAHRNALSGNHGGMAD